MGNADQEMAFDLEFYYGMDAVAVADSKINMKQKRSCESKRGALRKNEIAGITQPERDLILFTVTLHNIYYQ